ncbi:MAG TPA: DivIVA domain-containing protein [Gemmatimonadaceae bacterium]|jgi:DivIVA domain-containing protein|nr:DivIVA domain-containing protein [Gemmatimonadaceae bacterium]
MSDESFHLTPLDIRRYDFGAKSFRGYDEKKVEDFRNQVAEELERLTRVNQELDSKARGFHEQLRAFRERDKALNEALVSAQQLRSEIREQAEREAQLILREARAEGERQLDSIRNDTRQLEADIVGLEKSRRAFIGQLRQIAERQLAELAAAEGASRGAPAPSTPAPKASEDAEGENRVHMKTPAWLESLVKE